MELKHTDNEMTEAFLPNENLQTRKFTVAYSSKRRVFKNNSSGIKYGLSELSNDKTYLETELPARKRLKSENELFNTIKYFSKNCKAVVNDNNFVNEEKYSNEISNILSSEQGFENNVSNKVLLNTEINTKNTSTLKSGMYNTVFQSDILDYQPKLDSNFEKKSDDYDFEFNLENDLCENIDNDKTSNQGTESQTEFDEEFNKCCELLNLDVPRMAIVSTKDTEIANDNLGDEMIEIISHNNENQSSKTSYSQSNKFIASLNSMPDDKDIDLKSNSSDKILKIQNEFLNKEEKKFKSEGDSVLYTIVTSNSFLTTSNGNSLNINDKALNNEINAHAEDNILEFKFKNNDKNISTLEINNILNDNSKSIRESNILLLETIQNWDSKSNMEHLDLTNEDTLNSDTLKIHEENLEIISQNIVNDEIYEVSSAIEDSDDILSLYAESGIDFNETEEEISQTNRSEPASAILKNSSKKNGTDFHASPICDNKTCTYTENEVKETDHFIFQEKIDPEDVNHPLDEKKYVLNALDGISNNDCSKNKNSFEIKLNESFVSEYEISLLADDDDSILSEESYDSEYEISLLEDDTNDEENQNDLHEDESDSTVGSNFLPKGDEKIAAIPQGCIKEYENEQITDNVYLSEKKNDKIISEAKIHSKSISERKTSSPEERVPSNRQKNNKVDDQNDSDVKIPTQKGQIFRKIQSSENTDDKNEQNITVDTRSKIIIKLKKPTKLRSVNPIFKEELLKIETNVESCIPIKGIINRNELKNSEEKALIVNTNKYLTGSAYTNKATIAKIVKTELDVPNIRESKQTINDFQFSNKVVVNSKINKTKKIEENANFTTDTNKQLGDNAGTRKPIVKTELEVPNFVESKENVKFLPPNKVVVNSKTNGTIKSEEKVLITHTNKEPVNSAATRKPIVKTELEVHDTGGLKQNISDKFQPSNKVVVNSNINGINMSEEKVFITGANKQLADSACTRKPIAKIVKTELEVPNIGESKQNIYEKFQPPNKVVVNSKTNGTIKSKKVLITYTNKEPVNSAATRKPIMKTQLEVPDIGGSKQNKNDKFQPSNKVVVNSKTNGTIKSEEKVLITYTNKQLAENNCSDKAIGEKTIQTDLSVSIGNESKKDVKEIIPDYYEEEKEDLINPGWNRIKELSTDEERYRQVRDCWNSTTIPNPFKNLTYYSYRKRKFNSREDNTSQTKQHKRQASSNLNDKNAKRSRSCTYLFDDRIHSIKKEIETEKKALKDKMVDEVKRLNTQKQREEIGMQNFYGFNFDPRRQLDLRNLSRDYQERVSSIRAEYAQKINFCSTQYLSEIDKLKNNRNEVLQFYSFYKGLNTNEYRDPTVLTNAQMQELEEIENIYNQMDLRYKCNEI